MATIPRLSEEQIRQIIAAQGENPVAPIDQNIQIEAVDRGLGLADAILTRKQAQEDRIRNLREKIDQAKRERALSSAVKKISPLGGQAAEVAPGTAAEKILSAEFSKTTPGDDKIKQLFQLPSGETVGVTYGGNMRMINTPNNVRLDPLTKTLSAEQVEKTAGFESMLDLLRRIKEDVTNPTTGELTEEGKSYIGILDAPRQKAAGFTPAADPHATQFFQKIQDLKNQIIYLRSGKQINEQEYKRLRASLPSEYRDQKVFLSDLANFEKTFAEVLARRKQAFSAAGYKIPTTTGNLGQTPNTPRIPAPLDLAAQARRILEERARTRGGQQ